MFATFIEQIWQDIHPDARNFIAIALVLAFCSTVYTCMWQFWSVVRGVWSLDPPPTTCPCCKDKDEEEENEP